MKETKYYLDTLQRKWLNLMLKHPSGMSDLAYATVNDVVIFDFYTNSTKIILNNLRTEYLTAKKLG